jgi:putative glycosyltransferase (TIGR04348 family)
VTPAPRGTRAGNRVTALRWAALLRQLGHRVFVEQTWSGRVCELLIAVHAAKSSASVVAFHDRHPARPIVVLLAGTDIYPSFRPDPATLLALGLAARLVALQPEAGDALPAVQRAKIRTILQSAVAVAARRPPVPPLRACVLAHLRAVKNPLLPFRALAMLPKDLAVHVTLAGRALEPDLGVAARAAIAHEPRAAWAGELRRRESLRLLAASHLCIVPSDGEGGANVLSEAIAAGTPVLASDIPGNTGLLARDWPGLFPAGDAAALAALLLRCCREPAFRDLLAARTAALQPLLTPDRERAAWRALLAELLPPPPPPCTTRPV